MPNRVMEAKALKLQRQLRKLPRPLPDTTPQLFLDNKVRPIPKRLGAEGVVAPRQPNSELMQGYKHRAASLAREDKPGKFTGTAPGRREADEAIRRLEVQFNTYLSFTVLDTRVHRARVFFNPERTAYVLLYEKFYDDCEILRSLPHCDKKELIDNFRRKSLTFVKHVTSG